MRKPSMIFFIVTLMLSAQAFAASSNHPLADVDIEMNQAAYQRGAIVAKDLCMLCHEFKYIRYRNLLDIGFSEQQVNDIRGEFAMDEFLKASMTPEFAKEAFGMVPPDLSLIAKARKKGDRYIYTLLTTYHEVSENKYNNKLFPGIGMPDVFDWSVEVDEKRRTLQEQRIKDVTAFLVWASDPHADTRRAMGIWVIAYLALVSFLLWLWKRKVWANLRNAR